MTLRFGMFHTGVEVYGREWYFSGSDQTFYGVWAMSEPKRHPVHRYRRTVRMGQTTLSTEKLDEIIPVMRMAWPAWSYHISRRNCHHFTDFFCRTLGFNAGPKCGIFGAGDPSLFLEDSGSLRSRWNPLLCCRPRREPHDAAGLSRAEQAAYDEHQAEPIVQQDMMSVPVAASLATAANACPRQEQRPPNLVTARSPLISDEGRANALPVENSEEGKLFIAT